MRWEQLDLEGRLWTLPAQSTKAKRRHEVPLSDLALSIIEGVPQAGGQPVPVHDDAEDADQRVQPRQDLDR